jgi:hypothetical protein
MNALKFVYPLAFCIVLGCTKEEPSPRNYPRVNTQTVSQITEAGAVFSGEITFASVPILDHGFVWSNVANADPGKGDILSLGPKSGAGPFSAPCTYALAQGGTYYVRAYALSEDHAVYGDMITFVSRGSSAPVLKDFYPKEGTWDDEITFVGENLSAVESNMTIEFGAYRAFIIQSSSDKIIARVPYQLSQRETPVSLSLGSQKSTIASTFMLKSPVIQSITPAAAPSGTEVTIDGQFLNGPGVKVMFGNVDATLKSTSKTKIVCTVPDVTSGTLTVSVRTGEGVLVGDHDFEIQ